MAAGDSGDLYLAVVASKPNVAVTSVTGVGLTWTLVKAQCAARSQTRVEVWVAEGAGTAGTISATYGSAPSNAVITVSRYAGAGGIGAFAGANPLGVNGACSGGTDSNSYDLDLTTTANNSLVFVGAAMRNRTHTPGSGFTERMELMQGSGGSAAAAAAADKVVPSAGTTAVSGTFSGAVDWALVAVEVKSAGGAPPTATPTATTGATQTPSPTSPPTVTNTPTDVPTATSTPLPTDTPLPSQTPGASTVTPTATNTSVPTDTPVPTNTSVPTSTLVPTATATSSGSAPVHQQSVAGGSTASNTASSAALDAGSTGDLYLAVVSPKPNVAVTSVSGLGLTWTLVKAQCAARAQTRTEVWAAQGAGTNGAVTATFGSAPSSAVIAVSRYSGASGIGAVVGANTLGVNGACSGGTDNTSYSVDLTTTVNNSLAFGAAALRNRTHTPGSGYTERVEFRQGSGGSVAGAAAEDKAVPGAGTTAVNGTFGGSVDWAVVAVEVKP